ncbi:hypothetical protein D3C78_1836990 [compost metagenome]
MGGHCQQALRCQGPLLQDFTSELNLIAAYAFVMGQPPVRCPGENLMQAMAELVKQFAQLQKT